jgi:hypothetical protein
VDWQKHADSNSGNEHNSNSLVYEVSQSTPFILTDQANTWSEHQRTTIVQRNTPVPEEKLQSQATK